MSQNAYYIFLALMAGIILCIAVGLSIHAWYWRRKMRALRRQND